MFFVNYLKSLFTPTITSVVSDISKKVEQLETLAKKHEQNAQEHALVSDRRQQLSRIESIYKDKAKLIAGKLRALIS